MNPEKLALEVLGLGLLLILGGYFQIRQIQRDVKKGNWPPKRLYIPLVFSGLAFMGFIFLGVLKLISPRSPDFDLVQMSALVGKGIVFGLLLNGKALLSPAFVAYSLADSLHCWCEHDELTLWSLLNEILDWVFDGLPRWLKYTYLALTFTYALVCSLGKEVLEDNV